MGMMPSTVGHMRFDSSYQNSVVRVDLDDEFRCPVCRKLLWKGSLGPETRIQIKCTKCRQILNIRSVAGQDSQSVSADNRIAEAVSVIKETGRASIGGLRRRLKCSNEVAVAVMEELEREGVVGPASEKAGRWINEKKLEQISPKGHEEPPSVAREQRMEVGNGQCIFGHKSQDRGEGSQKVTASG